MVAHVIAGIAILTIGVLVIIITKIMVQVPVRNCPNCTWRIPGQCTHPQASQAPELLEIQMGMWWCPWRKQAGLRGSMHANSRPVGPQPLQDNWEKKGGVNLPPKGPKPDFSPPAQSPSGLSEKRS